MTMQKRLVLLNAIMSVAQIIVVTGLIFILYNYLLRAIGIELLGIWSLMLATTSVTQIANFGLSGSVVKFVAKYIMRKEDKNVSDVIQTATLSSGIFVAVILLISYPIITWALNLIIPNEYLSYALDILPFALLSLFIMTITSIFQAGLDGYQRFDLRSLILMGATLLYLILCFIFVPKYGLKGVAYAQVIQGVILLFGSWLMLRRCLPILPRIPYKFNKEIFKEIFFYGIKFQIITITAIFYDPITKVLLVKFGSLLMIGYYEMASKMIQQFRALIVSANQVLVPAIAALYEKIPEKIEEVYITSYQLLFYLSFPLYTLIIVCLPFISEIWIGHIEKVFILFSVLLSVGWFLSTLASPAYFANLGIGELRWNVTGHITVGLMNISLGYIFGALYDGIGVIIAWVISLAVGSSIIYLSYHIRHRISLNELIPRTSIPLITACLIAVLSTLIVHQKLEQFINSVALNCLTLLLFLTIVSVPFWAHPMRKRLTAWIVDAFIKSKTSG